MQSPLVSIGLPVYNGSDYLEGAIDSILTQTYGNIELLISDNGSTDNSQQIIRTAARQDGRVKTFIGRQNRGAAWNYNKVFFESSGAYFKWAAHDDLLHNLFVEECVNVMKKRPDVVLCFSRWADIDDKSNRIADKSAHPASLSADKITRFRNLIDLSHICEQVFGIIRRDALAGTRLIEAYADSDRVLLAELSLAGQFCEVPEILFYHRVHREGSVEKAPDRRSRAVWFDPSMKGVLYPFWRELLEYFRTPGRARMTMYERVQCHFEVCRWGFRRRRQLLKDLDFGLRSSVKKVLRIKRENS